MRSPDDVRRTDVLSEKFTTLADVFRASGYRTAAFVSNPWLDERFGFGQGFEIYDDSFARFEAHGRSVNRAALDWLAQLSPDERFFLYVHYVDTHQPYPLLSWAKTQTREKDLEPDLRPLSRRMISGERRV